MNYRARVKETLAIVSIIPLMWQYIVQVSRRQELLGYCKCWYRMWALADHFCSWSHNFFFTLYFSDHPLLLDPYLCTSDRDNYCNKSQSAADLADVKAKMWNCSRLNWINLRPGHSPHHMKNMSSDFIRLTQESLHLSILQQLSTWLSSLSTSSIFHHRYF